MKKLAVALMIVAAAVSGCKGSSGHSTKTHSTKGHSTQSQASRGQFCKKSGDKEKDKSGNTMVCKKVKGSLRWEPK